LRFRRRRVLFPFVGDTLGGSHVSALILIQALAATGYRPQIVLHEEGELAELLRARGIRYRLRPLPCYVEPPFKKPHIRTSLRRTAPRLLPFLLRHAIAIVHTNDLRAHATWATPARLAGARFVWHQRSANFGGSRDKLALARKAHRIVCVSDFVRRQLPEPLARSARVIRSPFDTQTPPPERGVARAALLAELGLAPDTALLGFFGNLLERKRPLEFVEAAARVRRSARRPVFFLLFGAEREVSAETIQRRAAELGIADRLRVMGFRQPIEPALAGCDLLLAPSVDEPFGRTHVEAMILGTPVVAADSGGNPEMIVDGETGLLVPKQDPESLARAALRLLGDPALAGAIAARAQLHARRSYSVEAHVAAITALYDELTGSRAGSR
jgi:glycosyltransferase involved in cell wall biosynthesis